ncbi:MAG TPA: PIN domain-containing protein [Candidatus Solibacter sp.]|nr:PIN domain-containing protein [Candidatus Solibacter sp.]
MIDHLRGYSRLQPGGGLLAYSVVTRCELLAGIHGEERARDLLDSMIEVPVDREIAEQAGFIRRRHGTMIADALIAATAMQLVVPLLTRNRRDFEGIKGLKLRPVDRP